MDDHKHNFSEEEWPFQDPVNQVAFTTTRVAYEGYPILLVSHDEDGDWQFLCGTTTETADAVVACLGCIFERHKFVEELATLPRGWLAWRDSDKDPWQMEQQVS